MADSMLETIYNPDVLLRLANLSNDEVFTPPEIANAMLDLLPQELFENPDTTFLDPATRTYFQKTVIWHCYYGIDRLDSQMKPILQCLPERKILSRAV